MWPASDTQNKSTMKTLLCFSFLIFCNTVLIAKKSTGSKSTYNLPENTGRKCECAAFRSNPTDEVNPIMEHNPLNVTCDDYGLNNCKGLCLELVMVNPEEVGKRICVKLDRTGPIKPSLYVRVCGKPWVFGDYTAKTDLCCENKEKTSCEAPISSPLD